jgi:signal recognition particle GTPase
MSRDLDYVLTPPCHLATGYYTDKLTALPQGSRLLISVSGIPGSGKTTLAGKVVRGVNSISRFGAGVAAMIPMV